MTELKKEENDAQPSFGWAFLKRLPSRLPNLQAHLIFWPLMIVGFALDLASKSAVFEWLEQQPYGSVSVIDGFLRLVKAQNPGAAFGIAAGKHYLLITVSVIAVVMIFTVFLFGRTRGKLMYIALGLFGAGICGNLYDRIFNDGLVRDFIDVYYNRYHWPAFNLADSMLCVGVGLMFISTLWFSRRPS